MRWMSRTSRTVHSSSRGDLVRRGLAAERLDELALDVHDLVELLDHVDRDADGPPLVRDRTRDGLANPPGRVRGELVAAPVVELLDRADQPERALLDQVQERQAAAQVALGDRDDEAEVRLDHLLLGVQVAALDPLGQRDFLLRGEQLHAPDRAQVQPQGVQARLDREVDLGLPRRVGVLLPAGLGPLEAAALADRGPPVVGDDVDALLLQVRMELGDLLLRDLDLLQRGGDLREGQDASVLAFRYERAKFIDLRDGDLFRQQHVRFGAQPLDP